MADYVKELYESTAKLDELVEEDITTIHVDILKDMFTGINKDEEHKRFIMAKWAELAGSPISLVRVINDDGETVLITPGILSNDLDDRDIHSTPIDDILTEADEMNNNFRGQGDRLIDHTFKTKLSTTNPTSWSAIIAYLNPPDDIVEESNEAEEEDDFDYFG